MLGTSHSMQLTRRRFLELAIATPAIAALAPWQPSRILGFDLASGPDYTAIVVRSPSLRYLRVLTIVTSRGELERWWSEIQANLRARLGNPCPGLWKPDVKL